MFKTTFITLFPEAFPGPLGVSILERAQREGKWSLETVALREFGLGKHLKVDAPPAGGGAGLVLRPDVAAAAIDSIERAQRPLIYLSPRGAPFDQAMARKFARGPGLICLCGRFEGLDERVIAARDMIEVSLGDFVLAGGDVAAMALTEAVVRLLPGVAGNSASLEQESFETGLLEHAHYTLPREWEGHKTPEILLSGDHKKIAKWQENQSLLLTKQRRSDLYAAYSKRQNSTAPESGRETFEEPGDEHN